MTRKTNSYYAGDDIVLPIRTSKPGTFDRNDPQSLREYADQMEAWQIADAAYKIEIVAYRQDIRARQAELCNDLADENEMTVPQASVLFNVAWADGHDEGFSAVIDRFEQLAELIVNFNTAGDWI
jgi:prepilin-type processing-associated H-X9-DG protein